MVRIIMTVLPKLKNLNKVLDNATLVRAEIYVGLFVAQAQKHPPKQFIIWPHIIKDQG